MLTRCYCVYDRKTLVYNAPYYAVTDGAAVRVLSEAVADTNHPLGRHPNDYVLFFVGTFDDQKGAMIPVSPLVHVIDASALVKQMQSEIPFPDNVTSIKNQDGTTLHEEPTLNKIA